MLVQQKAHADKINKLFFADGETVITAGQDGYLKKWSVDFKEGEISFVSELKLPEAILDTCMMEDKLAVASGNAVTLVDLSSFKAVKTVSIFQKPIMSLHFDTER